SHEVRTPLQPSLGWTEVVRRHRGLDDVTARALEAIHRNIRQQVRLVDDLLDLSRIVHGKFTLRFETVDLREAVRTAAEAFEESAGLKRVRMSIALPREPLLVWGDGARLQQITTNLGSNAIKPTPPPTSRTGPGPAGRLDDRAVLVVEDDDDTRGVLCFMLEAEGARVESAATGLAGVETAERVSPQIVLCDIGLPDIDGMEVARRLRSNAALSGTRLIALTGYGQAEDVRAAIEAGFDAHVTKPIHLDQLMAFLAPRAEPLTGAREAGQSDVQCGDFL